MTATPQPLEELAFFKDTWAGDVALPFATAKRGTGPIRQTRVRRPS